jgi:hypothetical protein
MLTSASKMAPSQMALSFVPPLISNSRRPATTSPPLRGRASMTLTPPRPASSSPPYRGLASANWRTGTPLGPPLGPECIVGRVVKLPEKSEVPATSRAHQQLDLHGQPWNHPVVITGESKDPLGEQLVTFRICTSFGGQGLNVKKAYHHHYFVVADETTIVSGRFSRGDNTHVNCSPGQEFTIEFKYLQLWTGTIQFSKEAMDSFNMNKPGPRPRRDSGYGGY